MKSLTILFIFAWVHLNFLFANDVVINELMISNTSSIQDETGENYDWIELYNPTDAIINLNGYFLSDDYENPYKWQFGDFDIESKGYLLVWASGKDSQFNAISPDMVEGLKAWFRADDKSSLILEDDSTITDGHLVTKWLSNNEEFYAFQDDSLLKPKLIANAIGELPAIRLDGTNDLFNTNFYAGQDNSPRTIIAMVANANMANANVKADNHVVHYGSYGSQKCYGISFQSQSRGGSIGNNYWTKRLYGTKRMDSDKHILSNMYDGKSDHIYVDCSLTAKAELELNTGSHYNLKIGSKIGNDGEFYGGDIAELMVFDTALDSITRKQIENYLVQKYHMNHISFHTNFKLSEGDAIVLSKPDSTICDSILDLEIVSDYSIGTRSVELGYAMYTIPTPGEPNTTKGYVGKLDIPEISLQSGLYNDSLEISLTSLGDSAVIYYTLDGSVPTRESFKYESPILLEDNKDDPNRLSLIKTTLKGKGFDSWQEPKGVVYKFQTLRARAFKENYSPSDIVTRSYVLDPLAKEHFKYTVISLVTDSLNFFDDTIGIYKAGVGIDSTDYKTAHFFQSGEEWERPVSVEIFSPDGDLMLQQDAGVRIHGNFSTTANLKSLRLYARSEYGDKDFDYKFFPNQEQDSYKRVILRNAGQDFAWAYMRDAFMQNLVSDLPIDVQDFNLSEVYLNGEFWGIHYMRERFGKFYLEENYGIATDEADVLEDANSVVEGDVNHYNALFSFIENENNDLSDSLVFEYVKTQMDCDNYINYISCNMFYAQNDWPQNNIKFWRKRTDQYIPDAAYGNDGRWRWFMFDTDYGFGRVQDYSYNMVNRILYDMSGWSPMMMQRLIGNDDNSGNKAFREDFVNRMGDLMNSNFKADRTLFKIDSMKQLLLPKIDEHIVRWNGLESTSKWDDKIEVMRKFARNRPDSMRQHLVEGISQVEDTALVTLHVNNQNSGFIKINKLVINKSTKGLDNIEMPYPWSGIYFKGVPVTLSAVPKEGYEFEKWSNGETTSTIKLSLDGGENVTAFFKPTSIHEDELIINEFGEQETYSWIEIYNPTQKAFNLKDYALVSGEIKTFVFGDVILKPDSYVVAATDSLSFTSDYHYNVLLTGNTTSSLSEQAFIKIISPLGATIDSVSLDIINSKSGASLEVIDNNVSNTIAENWQTSYSDNGTPGLSNSTPAYAIVINEIMASNDSTIATEAGEYEDWVELYNPLDIAVDLSGLYLTDNADKATKSQIYATSIPAKGFVLLWADGDTILGNNHLDFKLSAGGEFVGIFSPDGCIALDTISFGEQQTDISYGSEFDGGDKWVNFEYPTPNAANFVQTEVHEGDILVTEIMFDDDKAYSGGWIEIYNKSDNKYLLRDWTLKIRDKDDDDDEMFSISEDITIAQKSYLIICADTARFKAIYPQITNVYGDIIEIKDFDLIQILSDDNSVISSIEYFADLKDKEGSSNISLEILSPDSANVLASWKESYLFGGTPGAVNSTAAYQLRINELMASNSSIITTEDGSYEDWIELYNPLDVTVDAAGLYITDNSTNPTLHKISDISGDSTLIEPMDFMLLWADKNPENGFDHINFKLSTAGEEVVLYGRDGLHVIDKVVFDEQSENVSVGLEYDGGEEWSYFINPTPAASNDIDDAISDIVLNKVQIYPNPAKTLLNISSENDVTIELYNLLGKRVLGGVQVYGGITQSINVSAVPLGVYLLKVSSKNLAPVSYKVVIEK